MPIHTGMKTIRIPHASNKRWLTLFYAMPRELVGKVQTYLDFPRCPYEVLRTDKYDRLINDDMFLELIWDCTAWAAWKYIEVPCAKGGYHEIPGSRMVQEAVLLFCIREFYILCLEELQATKRSMKWA